MAQLKGRSLVWVGLAGVVVMRGLYVGTSEREPDSSKDESSGYQEELIISIILISLIIIIIGCCLLWIVHTTSSVCTLWQQLTENFGKVTLGPRWPLMGTVYSLCVIVAWACWGGDGWWTIQSGLGCFLTNDWTSTPLQRHAR